MEDNVKLSELIKKFEAMDNEETGGKRVLTEDQKYIFKDIITNYKKAKYSVLDARSGLMIGSL